MIQKITFIDGTIDKPIRSTLYDEDDVLNLAECEVIEMDYILSPLQKLWLLNLSNRDGIATMKEGVGYIVISLRNQYESFLVTNGRFLYDATEILNSKDSDLDQKKIVLDQYMHGKHLDYYHKGSLIDKVYDPKEMQGCASIYAHTSIKCQTKLYVSEGELTFDISLDSDVLSEKDMIDVMKQIEKQL